MLESGVLKAAIAAVAIGFGSMFAQVDFRGTITLGSILIAVLIAAIAGFATIRSRVSSIWREEAAGWREKAERLEEALAAERTARADEGRAQQEIRHQLKNDLAASAARLKVEEAKHDLGVLLERMQELHTEAMTTMGTSTVTAVENISESINDLGRRLDTGQAQLVTGQEEQKQILAEIRDALRDR